MRLRTIAFTVLAALLLGLSSACVTEYEEPAWSSKLIVTRAGDTANLNWQTRPGYLYSVLYPDPRNNRKLIAVEGCFRIRGTGGQLQGTDRVRAGTKRSYHINEEPMSSTSR